MDDNKDFGAPEEKPMNARPAYVGAVICLSLLAAQTALGGAVTFASVTYARTINPITGAVTRSGNSQTGVGAASTQVNGSYFGGSYDLNASATATATALRGVSAATLQSYSPGAYQVSRQSFDPAAGLPANFAGLSNTAAGAFASWTDSFGVTGTDPLNLTFHFDLSGVTQGSSFSGPLYYVNGSFGVFDQTHQTSSRISFGTNPSPVFGPQPLPSSLTFTTLVVPGTTVNLTFTLQLEALIADSVLRTSDNSLFLLGTGVYDAAMSLDLSHTIELSEVLITDGNNQPVPGAQLVSGSSSQYPLSPLNSVPEGQTFVLVAAGLGALWGRRISARFSDNSLRRRS